MGTKYYTLQRIIRCEACDGYLRIQSSRQQKYYKEVSAERGLECKFSARSVQRRVMDQKVIGILSALCLPGDWQNEVSRRAEDRDIALITVKKRSKIEESLRRLDDVYTDFVNSRITRFKPTAEFTELFRIAAPLSGWEERDDGSFIVRSDDTGKK